MNRVLLLLGGLKLVGIYLAQGMVTLHLWKFNVSNERRIQDDLRQLLRQLTLHKHQSIDILFLVLRNLKCMISRVVYNSGGCRKVHHP